MNQSRQRGTLRQAFVRGYFPHQFSWLLDNPLRRFLFPPSRVVDRLPLSKSDSVLELGPGSGYFSVELARRVPLGKLELLDLQPEMLAKARRKLLAAGCKNVGFTAQDASLPLPYEAETFDVAILVAVLGEVPDPKSCLRGVRRVLRPGACLAVHEYLFDPDHIPFAALRSLVGECGFRFQKRIGPLRHYTALFAVDEPPPGAAQGA